MSRATVALAVAEAIYREAEDLEPFAKGILNNWDRDGIPERAITRGRTLQWRTRRTACLYMRRKQDKTHVCKYCEFDRAVAKK